MIFKLVVFLQVVTTLADLFQSLNISQQNGSWLVRKSSKLTPIKKDFKQTKNVFQPAPSVCIPQKIIR